MIFRDTLSTPKCWLGYTGVSRFFRGNSCKGIKKYEVDGSRGRVVEYSLACRKHETFVVWLAVLMPYQALAVNC